MNQWQPIETFKEKSAFDEFDIWLHIYASPRSMGMEDSFRVTNAYMKNGKWFHRQNGEEKEIYAPYVTHWMPVPPPPKEWLSVEEISSSQELHLTGL